MTNEELVREIQAGNNVQGNLEALYNQNRGMIAKVAASYQEYCDIDDLMQEAYFGIDAAARKYDPECGTNFSSYAFHWIKQRCSRYCRNNSRIIRIPVWKYDQLKAYHEFLSKYREEHQNEEPEDEDICKALGIKKVTLYHIRETIKKIVIESLQQPLDEMDADGETIGDAIEDKRWMESPEEPGKETPLIECVLLLLEKDEAQAVRDVILSDQSYEVIAAEKKVSPDAVYRKVSRAIGKLKVSKKLQDLISINDYDSSAAYRMSVTFAITNFTSSTEMLAIRRVMIEQELKELEQESATLQDIQNRLDFLFEGILTDKRKILLREKYWNGKTNIELSKMFGIPPKSVDKIRNDAFEKLKKDGRIYDIARDARKAFRQYQVSQLTPEMISLKRFLERFSDAVSDKVSDKKG